MTDSLPHAELAPVPLNTTVVGSRILTYSSVASTNDYALRLGGNGTVIVADCQTAGRGRQGRAWHSAPGLGLWFSIAFEECLNGLGFAAALAVRDALNRYCETALKWPNDLLIGGRKVCGILVEHRKKTTAIGIGINVHHRQEDFPEELRGKATSLALSTALPVDRSRILREVLTELDKKVMLLQSGGGEAVWREWAEACNVRGRRIRFGGNEGRVLDIDAAGALCVETAAGLRRLVSGEITMIDGE